MSGIGPFDATHSHHTLAYHGIPSDNVIKQKYYIPEFEAVLQRFLQVGGKGMVELQNFVAQRQELVTAMLEVYGRISSLFCTWL